MTDTNDLLAIRWQVYRNARAKLGADGQEAVEYTDPLEQGVDYHLLEDPAAFVQSIQFVPPHFANSRGSGHPPPMIAHVVAEVTSSIDVAGRALDTPATRQLGLRTEVLPLSGDVIFEKIASLFKVQVPVKPIVPGAVTIMKVVPRGAEDTEFVVKTASLQAQPDVHIDGAIGLDSLLTSINGTAIRASAPNALALHDIASSIAILTDPVDRVAATLALLSEPVDRIAAVMALLSEPADRVAATLALLSEPVDRVAATLALSTIPADRLADAAALLAIPLDKVAQMIELVGKPVGEVADALHRLGYPAEKSAEALALLVEPIAGAINFIGSALPPFKGPRIAVDASQIKGAFAPVSTVTAVGDTAAEIVDMGALRARIHRLLNSGDVKSEIRRIMETTDFKRRVALTVDDSDLPGRLAAAIDRRDFEKKIAPLQQPNRSRDRAEGVISDRSRLERLIQQAELQSVSRGLSLPIRLQIRNPDFTKHLIRREDDDPIYKSTNTKRYLPEIPNLLEQMELLDDLPPGCGVLAIGSTTIPFSIHGATWDFFEDASPTANEKRSLSPDECYFINHTADRKLQKAALFMPKKSDSTHFLSVKLTISVGADPANPDRPSLAPRTVELPRVPIRLLGLDLIDVVANHFSIAAPPSILPGAPLKVSLKSGLLPEGRTGSDPIRGVLPVGDDGLSVPFEVSDVVWEFFGAPRNQLRQGPGSKPSNHGPQDPSLGDASARGGPDHSTPPASIVSALEWEQQVEIPKADVPGHIQVRMQIKIGDPAARLSSLAEDSRVVHIRSAPIQIGGLDLRSAIKSQLLLVAPPVLPAGGTFTAELASPLLSGIPDHAGEIEGRFSLPGAPAAIPLRVSEIAVTIKDEKGGRVWDAGLVDRWRSVFELGAEGSPGVALESVMRGTRSHHGPSHSLGPDRPFVDLTEHESPLRMTGLKFDRAVSLEMTTCPSHAAHKRMVYFSQGIPSEGPISLCIERIDGRTFWVGEVRSAVGAVSSGNAAKATKVMAVAESRWQHIVMTWGQADGTLSLYVDGELVGRSRADHKVELSADDIWIGGFDADSIADPTKRAAWGTDPAHSAALVESVSLYARELTPEEVNARREAHPGSLPLLGVPKEDVTRFVSLSARVRLGEPGSALLDELLTLGPVPIRCQGFDVEQAALAGVKLAAPLSVSSGAPLVAELGQPRLADAIDAARISGAIAMPSGLEVPFAIENVKWKLAALDVGFDGPGATVSAGSGHSALVARFATPILAKSERRVVSVVFDVIAGGRGGFPKTRWTQKPRSVTVAIEALGWEQPFRDACRVMLAAESGPARSIRAELQCSLLDDEHDLTTKYFTKKPPAAVPQSDITDAFSAHAKAIASKKEADAQLEVKQRAASAAATARSAAEPDRLDAADRDLKAAQEEVKQWTTNVRVRTEALAAIETKVRSLVGAFKKNVDGPTGRIPLPDQTLPGIAFEIRNATWNFYDELGKVLAFPTRPSPSGLAIDFSPPLTPHDTRYFVELVVDFAFVDDGGSARTDASDDVVRVSFKKVPTLVRGVNVENLLRNALRVKVPKLVQPGQPISASLECPFVPAGATEVGNGIIPIPGGDIPGGLAFKIKAVEWKWTNGSGKVVPSLMAKSVQAPAQKPAAPSAPPDPPAVAAARRAVEEARAAFHRATAAIQAVSAGGFDRAAQEAEEAKRREAVNALPELVRILSAKEVDLSSALSEAARLAKPVELPKEPANRPAGAVANPLEHLFEYAMPAEEDQWTLTAIPTIEVTHPGASPEVRPLDLSKEASIQGSVRVLGRDAILAKLGDAISMKALPRAVEPGEDYEVEVEIALPHQPSTTNVKAIVAEVDLAGHKVPVTIELGWEVLGSDHQPTSRKYTTDRRSLLKRSFVFSPAIEILGRGGGSPSHIIRTIPSVTFENSEVSSTLAPLTIEAVVRPIEVPALFAEFPPVNDLNFFEKKRLREKGHEIVDQHVSEDEVDIRKKALLPRRVIILPEFYRSRCLIDSWPQLLTCLTTAQTQVRTTLAKLLGAMSSSGDRIGNSDLSGMAHLAAALELLVSEDDTDPRGEYLRFATWNEEKRAYVGYLGKHSEVATGVRNVVILPPIHANAVSSVSSGRVGTLSARQSSGAFVGLIYSHPKGKPKSSNSSGMPLVPVSTADETRIPMFNGPVLLVKFLLPGLPMPSTILQGDVSAWMSDWGILIRKPAWEEKL